MLASLREEKRELEKTAYRIRDRLKNAPKGYLRIRKKRGYMEYYYVDKTDSTGSNGDVTSRSFKKAVRRGSALRRGNCCPNP